jgi:hypothetical protein
MGYCIYCKSDGGGDLRDEHILPYGLGGRIILPKATCVGCATITGRLEEALITQFYHVYRKLSRIPSRRRGKKRKSKPLTVVAKYRGKEEVLEVSPEEYPLAAVLPIFPEPGIFRGAEEFEEPIINFTFSGYHPRLIRKRLGLTEGEILDLEMKSPTMDCNSFRRAVAKIAYCHALANPSLRDFRPFTSLLKLIRGDYTGYAYLTGSSATSFPRDLPNRCEISTTVANWPWHLHVGGEGSSRIVCAQVRLFTAIGGETSGSPAYEVVLGTPR